MKHHVYRKIHLYSKGVTTTVMSPCFFYQFTGLIRTEKIITKLKHNRRTVLLVMSAHV